MVEQTPKEFAAWKFDTIELLNIGLDHREARVAICLLGRMNRITRLINPSQRWVATMLGMDESAVRRAIKVMVDEVGIIEVERGNRQRSNRYTFSTSKLNAFYDLREERREIARLSDREEVSAQKSTDEEETPSPEQEEAPSTDREEVSPKHFNGTINWNTEEEGIDESGSRPLSSSTVPREEGGGGSEPPGERTPTTTSGEPRSRPEVSEALLNSDIVKGVSAKQSLDVLEAQAAERRRRVARADPRYAGVDF